MKELFVGLLLAAALAAGVVLAIALFPEDGNQGSSLAEAVIPESEFQGTSYLVLDCQDYSMKALGNKVPSQFTTAELTALPVNEKHSCRVVVGTEIIREEIEPLVHYLIRCLRDMNPDWDEIGLDFYTTYDRVDGPWDVASAVWSTNGKWGGIDAEIARDNRRSTHSASVRIKEDLEEYLQSISVSEEQHGLSENQRRQIFGESVECEDTAMFEAAMRYDSMCSRCSKFITEDFSRMASYQSDLREDCESALARSYRISTDTLEEIGVEGVRKNWPMPELPAWPACCN